jgi:hypothetical protein
MTRREKRTAKLQTHVPPSTREQLELFVKESNVLSMSDYLFEVVEEHIAWKAAMRISKQKIGRRVGNQ